MTGGACAALSATTGEPCRTPRRRGKLFCINHDPDYAEERQRNARAGATASHEPRRPREPAELPDAVAARDPGATAWTVIEQLLSGTLAPREAATLATLLRAAGALSDEPETAYADTPTALCEVVLRGKVSLGIPPETPEEWELAEQRFNADALAEIRRWEPRHPGQPSGTPSWAPSDPTESSRRRGSQLNHPPGPPDQWAGQPFEPWTA